MSRSWSTWTSTSSSGTWPSCHHKPTRAGEPAGVPPLRVRAEPSWVGDRDVEGGGCEKVADVPHPHAVDARRFSGRELDGCADGRVDGGCGRAVFAARCPESQPEPHRG